MITIKAEGAALVAEVSVQPGDAVQAGTVLLRTELMKMQHEICAPESGRIEQVLIHAGQEVAADQPMILLEPGDVAGTTAPDTGRERPELAAFTARMALLDDAARPDAVARRHAKGYRTARENIADLFDEGSFVEYGALAIAAQRTRRDADTLAALTPADGIICGTGTVAGRPVAAMAVDYTVLAGTQGFYHHRKIDRLIEVAARAKLPIVLFAEGGGGRPNDYDVSQVMAAGLNITSFRHFATYPGPKIAIAAGYCFAGNAALFGVCDLRIATDHSWIGMGGPAMIEGGGLGVHKPTEIGPADVQAKTGLIDLRTQDEAAAVAATKTLLALAQDTPEGQVDDAALRHVIPVDRTRAYDMRGVISAVADTDSFLELRRGFGSGMITGFARIKGRAMGILANNPLHLGGAIDAQAADKGARFLQLCDAWGMPVVSLCDTPGFMVGPEVEDTGQVAHVSRLFLAGAHFAQPMICVILRKGYGLGAMAMAGGGFDRPDLCCAWPTAEIGAMGIEGAVRLGYRDHLAAITDDAARQLEFTRLVDEMLDRGRALNAASFLEFDAVIDPADTRDTIRAALRAAGPTAPSGRYVDAW